MFKDIISDTEFFKVYHPSTKLTGQVVDGSGNDPIALGIVGIVLLIIVGLIIYINGSTNLSKNYTNPQLVEFFINNTIIIEFIFPFGDGQVLDLTNITVE